MKPSGVLINDNRRVSDFHNLDLKVSDKVILTQDVKVSLTLSDSDNLVSLVVTHMSNGGSHHRDERE